MNLSWRDGKLDFKSTIRAVRLFELGLDPLFETNSVEYVLAFRFFNERVVLEIFKADTTTCGFEDIFCIFEWLASNSNFKRFKNRCP